MVVIFWFLSYNPGQSIWNKIEKSSKTRQEKRFDIYFCVFWLLLPKFNFWKGDWALGYVSNQIYTLFPKNLSLKSFGNSWDN